jgi:hypothetical protein
MNVARVSTRPTSLSVVAGGWIAVGSLQVLGSLNWFVDLIRFQIAAATHRIPADFARQTQWMVVAGYAFAIVSLAFTGFTVVSAAQLLRMRSWARTSLEVISWFQLALALAGGLWFAFGFAAFFGSSGIGGWLAVPLAMFSITAGLLFVSLWLLRSDAVRSAVNQATADRMVESAMDPDSPR